MKSSIWISVSALLAVLRIGGEKSEAFQAVAHLWVGALLYAWIAGRNASAKRIAIVLSVIEVVRATIDHWSQLTDLVHWMVS
jgi:hypothetical protein